MQPIIVYEDKELIAVNKPAGLLVHGVRGHEENKATLTAWLTKHYPAMRKVGDEPVLRPGIVHRLDRDTSGVMVVAKTQASFEYLKSLFQAHAIKKKYLALVHGILREKSGVINKPIGMRSGTVKRSVRGTKLVKEAVTRYIVKREFGEGENGFSLLEVAPLTGRTHQIRVHLASLHHPILGDVLYGKKKEPLSPPRLMLHASSLEFPREDGQRLMLEAKPPHDFLDFVNSLGVIANNANVF